MVTDSFVEDLMVLSHPLLGDVPVYTISQKDCKMLNGQTRKCFSSQYQSLWIHNEAIAAWCIWHMLDGATRWPSALRSRECSSNTDIEQQLAPNCLTDGHQALRCRLKPTKQQQAASGAAE